MGKFYLNSLPKEQRIKIIAEFYDTIDCLKKRDEIRLLFRDLLTPDEMAMLVRRIEVAILLLAGFSVREIVDNLRVGTDKVIKVRRALKRHGEGYKLAIKRLQAKRSKRRKKTRAPRSYGDPLKTTHPLYYLSPSNLLDVLEEGEEDLIEVAGRKIERKIKKKGY